jgi:hypothetical protein
MYVTFDATEKCRTGNKLIQYLTCKLIGHLFGHTYVAALAEESVTVAEEDFGRILVERPYYLSFVNIHIKGLFQRSEWFVPYRQLLLDLIYDPFNRDYWVKGDGTTVFVKDLVADVPLSLEPDALFMSVRLDDFMHYPWHAKSDIPYPSFYTDLLRKLSFSKLYIICDRVRHDWEWEYLNAFAPWNPILLQESFEHDCCLMRTCKRLIHSNSTLCWVMSFLSRGVKERYIPNTRHYPEQCLEAIDPGDKVFYPDTMTHAELGCIGSVKVC